MKILFLSILLFTCFFVKAVAEDINSYEAYIPSVHLVEVAQFKGDYHGDFKGDPLVILSDGSAWKIHPKDSTKIENWSSNDPVYLEVRSSGYWYKREHHFHLINSMHQDAVRVMFVRYPDNPLTIIKKDIRITGTRTSYTFVNANPAGAFVPYTSNTYETTLTLSDHSKWVRNGIKGCIGDQVYVVTVNDRKDHCFISGLEREVINYKVTMHSQISEEMEDPTYSNLKTCFRYVSSVKNFEGDKHGQFTNDLVAVLNDGSAWKIHPEDRVKFSHWNDNEIVRPEIRKSSYWFKREHKFQLYNHHRRDFVRVMLVQYPDDALTIIDSKMKVIDYDLGTQAKKIILSDGSSWKIKNKDIFDDFNIGNPVYVGKYLYDNSCISFIISGIEREAQFQREQL